MNLTIQDAIAQVMPNAIASGLLVSLCSIQKPDGTFDAGGAPAVGSNGKPIYVPVAGLQNITCMSAQPRVAITATENKTESEILGLQFRHVLLSGYFPQIPQGDSNWQAVVDGITWDLIGAESDSQTQMTRLEIRIGRI